MKQIVVNNLWKFKLLAMNNFFNWQLNDIGDTWLEKGKSITNFLMKITPAIAVIAIVITGLMMMGGRKTADSAKTWLFWILVGCAVVFGASGIYDFFVDGIKSGL